MLWSGVAEERVLETGQEATWGQMLGLQLVLQFLKQVQEQILTPLMFFFFLLPCQATKRKNRKDKSTAKIQP